MRITSSIAGHYPVLVPAARKPAAANGNDDLVSREGASDVSGSAASAITAIDQANRQRTGETKRELLSAADFVQMRPNVEESNVGGVTRQFNSISNRVSVESFEQRLTQGSVQGTDQSTAQRAVTAYTDVATQEHRDELVAMLGIDVFA